MARNESRKLHFTLLVVSVLLHLLVFAISSHEYIWPERARASGPVKFRIVSVEKPEESLPPNTESRFLSNANRKESGAGRSTKTPRLRRGRRDLLSSRGGSAGAGKISLAPPPVVSGAPRPAPKRPKPPDPLAMFRVKPSPKGRPEAPRPGISDGGERLEKQGPQAEPEGGEAISLDTRDFRYASYFAHIRRKIRSQWIWPSEARSLRGTLSLVFEINSDGSLKALRVKRSAGARILDDLAMAAVTKAAPFGPFPEGIPHEVIEIQGRFSYE